MIDMSSIKHISFDMWNTLISPNPAYTEARTKFLSGFFCLEEEVVKKWYRGVKSSIDQMSELYGMSVTVTHAIQQLLMTIPKPDHREYLNDYNIGVVKDTFQTLFYANSPIVLPETITMLKRIEESGRTISIGSNTNFISGATLKPIVDDWGVDWSFMMFSDMMSCSKPHQSFFNIMLEQAQRNYHEPIRKNQVLHVGDHLICDASAMKYGLQTTIIDDPKHLVESFAELNF